MSTNITDKKIEVTTLQDIYRRAKKVRTAIDEHLRGQTFTEPAYMYEVADTLVKEINQLIDLAGKEAAINLGHMISSGVWFNDPKVDSYHVNGGLAVTIRTAEQIRYCQRVGKTYNAVTDFNRAAKHLMRFTKHMIDYGEAKPYGPKPGP